MTELPINIPELDALIAQLHHDGLQSLRKFYLRQATREALDGDKGSRVHKHAVNAVQKIDEEIKRRSAVNKPW